MLTNVSLSIFDSILPTAYSNEKGRNIPWKQPRWKLCKKKKIRKISRAKELFLAASSLSFHLDNNKKIPVLCAVVMKRCCSPSFSSFLQSNQASCDKCKKNWIHFFFFFPFFFFTTLSTTQNQSHPFGKGPLKMAGLLFTRTCTPLPARCYIWKVEFSPH